MIAWRMRALRLRARLRLRRARSGFGVCIMAGGRPLTIDEQSGQRDRRIVSYLNYRFSPTLKTAVTSLCLILGNYDGVKSHTDARTLLVFFKPLSSAVFLLRVQVRVRVRLAVDLAQVEDPALALLVRAGDGALGFPLDQALVEHYCGCGAAGCMWSGRRGRFESEGVNP